MILRGLTSKLGLGVPYIESSPQSHDDAGNSFASGNSHHSCWKYALFETDGHPERYRGHFERVCSFDSEFCIQGPCDQRTLRAFLTDEHAWPPDDVWTYHIQRGHKNLPHWEQTMMIAGGDLRRDRQSRQVRKIRAGDARGADALRVRERPSRPPQQRRHDDVDV